MDLVQTLAQIDVTSAPGIYTLIATSSFGCIDSASIEININPQPVVNNIVADQLNCVDEQDSLLVIPSVSPIGADFDFMWTGPDGFNSTDSIATIYGLSEDKSGFYYLSIALDGCMSALDSIEITFAEIPEAASIEGDSLVCEGDTILLFADGNFSANTDFFWQTPDGNQLTNEAILQIPFASLNNAGNYWLTVVENGCESPISDSFYVAVNPFIGQPLITGASQFCEGDSIVLTTDNIANATYIWLGPVPMTTMEPELNIFPAAANTAGYYQVQVVLGRL